MGRRKIGNVHGVMLLDKPGGSTSNYVLQKVRRHLGAGKAGHTGALDPLATGLLPLCFGEATKYSQWSLEADKAYQVTARLGVSTETADADGVVTGCRPLPPLDNDDVQCILDREFAGPITQTPPRYSALKHEGKPLYQLAREGRTVPDKSRTVTLHRTRLLDSGPDWLLLEVHCSKGTYIRSLVEDLAVRLGTLGHVAALRRLRHGRFNSEQAVPLQDILGTPPVDSRALMEPVDACVADLPILSLTKPQWSLVRHGHSFRADNSETGSVRLYFRNKFCGLGEVMGDQTVKCLRLVNTDLLP